jgi:alpha-1,3-rhamnosyl/mannosyltransferase
LATAAEAERNVGPSTANALQPPPDEPLNQRSDSVAFRVGFDGRAFSSPARGVRRYAWELTRALLEEVPGLRIVALGLERQELAPPGVSLRSGPFTPSSNFGWSLVGLPWAAAGAELDLYHAPAYTAPLLGLRPRVVTVHDVSYARAPHDYPYKLDPLRQWFYRESATRADAVITDSEFSKSEIVTAYGIPDDRISVVPLGVGPPFRPAEEVDRLVPLPAGVAPRYTLHVGDLHVRRRPAFLLEAVLRTRLLHASLSDLQLVLVGRDHGCADALMRQAADAGAPDALQVLGVVPDPMLILLVQRAAAFLYASRYEGFGLPPLEAMACGTPVVAVQSASIGEVVGTGGLLLHERATAGEFAEAIGRVLLVPASAAELRGAGLARAAQLTWERTARKTLDVYESVTRGRRGASLPPAGLPRP